MNQILSIASPTTAGRQSVAEMHGVLSFRPRNAKPVIRGFGPAGDISDIVFEADQRMVPIGDMRAIADTLSIDREGFELVRH